MPETRLERRQCFKVLAKKVLSSCLQQLKLSKIRRRAAVVYPKTEEASRRPKELLTNLFVVRLF